MRNPLPPLRPRHKRIPLPSPPAMIHLPLTHGHLRLLGDNIFVRARVLRALLRGADVCCAAALEEGRWLAVGSVGWVGEGETYAGGVGDALGVGVALADDFAVDVFA